MGRRAYSCRQLHHPKIHPKLLASGSYDMPKEELDQERFGRIVDGLPAQAVSMHRMLSALAGEVADGIDVEAEACRLRGFDPATHTLMEGLSEMPEADKEDADGRFCDNQLT